jgi:hypothetical protein
MLYYHREPVPQDLIDDLMAVLLPRIQQQKEEK